MVQITLTVLWYKIAVMECGHICGKALQVRLVAHNLHCISLTVVDPFLVHSGNFLFE